MQNYLKKPQTQELWVHITAMCLMDLSEKMKYIQSAHVKPKLINLLYGVKCFAAVLHMVPLSW